MAGQTNSWIDTIQTKGAPCIGDTIKSSGGSTGEVVDPNATGGETLLSNVPWMWILIGAGVGYLLRGK